MLRYNVDFHSAQHKGEAIWLFIQNMDVTDEINGKRISNHQQSQSRIGNHIHEM